MKTGLTIILTLILTIPALGNDGAYLTHGGVIYPTKENKISLDREILSFSVWNKICYVDILFEFNNPENVERKLLIGFQAPTAAGDVSDKICNTNQITDFKILSNGKVLPYKIKAAECEDCELKDPKNFYFSQFEPGLFVYLFELTFKPGINKINHSYAFPASSNVLFGQIYNYILTTGAKWAGGTIKNLTVQFDLGRNTDFYVDDVFGENAVWSIIGSGKVTNSTVYSSDDETARMVRVLSGKLQIDVKDFHPKSNIGFSMDNKSIPRHLSLEDNYTKGELRLLKNTIYAQYGYVFKSKDLQDYFSQLDWYIPDPNLTMEQIVLTEEEKELIEEIESPYKKELKKVLNHPTIDNYYKEIYKHEKLIQADDIKMLSIMDSLFTKNQETSLFFFIVFTKSMNGSDGFYSEALGFSALEFITTHTIEFASYFNIMPNLTEKDMDNWVFYIMGELQISADDELKAIEKIERQMLENIKKSKEEYAVVVSRFIKKLKTHKFAVAI